MVYHVLVKHHLQVLFEVGVFRKGWVDLAQFIFELVMVHSVQLRYHAHLQVLVSQLHLLRETVLKLVAEALVFEGDVLPYLVFDLRHLVLDPLSDLRALLAQPLPDRLFPLLRLKQRSLSVCHHVRALFINHDVDLDHLEPRKHVPVLMDDLCRPYHYVAGGDGCAELQHIQILRVWVFEHACAHYVQVVHFESEQALLEEELQLQLVVGVGLRRDPQVHIGQCGLQFIQVHVLQQHVLFGVEDQTQVLLEDVLKEGFVETDLVEGVFGENRKD